MNEDKGPLIFMVLFIILSLVFGVFSYMKYDALTGTDSPTPKIKKLTTEISDLEAEIAKYQERAESLRRDIAARKSEYETSKELNDIYRIEYDRRLKLKQSAEKYDGHATELSGTVTAIKTKTGESIDKDIREAKALMEKEVADKDKAKTDAIARFRTLEDDLKSAKQKTGNEKNYYQSSLDEAKSVLSDLTQRDVERANVFKDAKGKVILSDPVHNTIMIDRGTADGVKNGYRFEVYAIRGSERVTKGYIEVRKADISRSECLIVMKPIELPKDPLSSYIAGNPEAMYSPYQESGRKGASAQLLSATPKQTVMGMNPTDPIVEGDLLCNPFYVPGKNYTYYIAGNKEIINERQKSAIRYRWTEIKQVIESYGSKVAPTVDINVNYMIAQKNPQEDAEFKKGVDLGIPVIYEWELFRFLDNR